MSLLKKVIEVRNTERNKAIGELIVGAFFYAMRSCEYLTVAAGERKTKRLKLKNIRFFRNGTLIPHWDPLLTASDFVTVQFEDQKNGEKMDEITQQKSGDLVLCPVRAWASIIQRVHRIPGSSSDTHVNAFYDNGKMHYISGKDVRNALRAAATIMGKDKLGFNANEIGTHSLRSGAALAMYLDEVPVYSIMLLGRWSSDAFLRYIRKQVEQFSHNISNRMIRHQHFTHVPQTEQRVSRHDPRQRNNSANLQTRTNLGGASNIAARLSRLTMWH